MVGADWRCISGDYYAVDKTSVAKGETKQLMVTYRND